MSGKYKENFGRTCTRDTLTTFALCLGLLLGLVIGAGVARVAGWGGGW